MSDKTLLFGLVATMLIGLSAGACSRPYAPPAFEPTDASFPGLRDLVALSPDRRLRLLATHGMCSHIHRADGPDSWVAKRAGTIASALGLTDTPPVIRSSSRGIADGNGKVDRRDVHFRIDEGTIEATFLTWGTVVDPHRDALAYDNASAPDPGSPIRASLNAQLRAELLNRCLIDAVVYVGRNGDGLRAAMRAELCEATGGVPATRRDAPECTPKERFRQPETLVLLAESLGSTIMFDAFTTLDDSTPGGFDALSDLRAIYLVSNQTPLLDRANRPSFAETSEAEASGLEVPVVAPSTLEELLRRISENPEAAGFEFPRSDTMRPIDVVAFTDPSDILSFRLRDTRLARPGLESVSFINVLVSNSATYFGALVNPISAHRGYETNRDVIRLIAKGRSR